MTTRIVCECQLCDCNAKFVAVDTEDLINLIQHGRLTQEQTDGLKVRVGSRSCKQCFVGNHQG
ncbi:DUF1899 domain-containing protein [archaeon]|nr:DUF1899 domain-containing protein [archaeon]